MTHIGATFFMLLNIYTLRILMSFVFDFFFLVSNDTFNDTLKTDDNYSHFSVVYWFWSSFSLFGILCRMVQLCSYSPV